MFNKTFFKLSNLLDLKYKENILKYFSFLKIIKVWNLIKMNVMSRLIFCENQRNISLIGRLQIIAYPVLIFTSPYLFDFPSSI